MRRSLCSVAVDANNEVTSSPAVEVEPYHAALTAHALKRFDRSTVIASLLTEYDWLVADDHNAKRARRVAANQGTKSLVEKKEE
jgi:hypothetical protein